MSEYIYKYSNPIALKLNFKSYGEVTLYIPHGKINLHRKVEDATAHLGINSKHIVVNETLEVSADIDDHSLKELYNALYSKVSKPPEPSSSILVSMRPISNNRRRYAFGGKDEQDS